MRNPLGSEARGIRRGIKNFQNCPLKNIEEGESRGVRLELTCPTQEDESTRPIAVESSDRPRDAFGRVVVKNEELRILTSNCGETICKDCVYVGMTDLGEVEQYRNSKTPVPETN